MQIIDFCENESCWRNPEVSSPLSVRLPPVDNVVNVEEQFLRLKTWFFFRPRHHFTARRHAVDENIMPAHLREVLLGPDPLVNLEGTIGHGDSQAEAN